MAPPLGPYWGCAKCHQPFDTFATQSICPNCAARYPTTTCLDCRESRPYDEWIVDRVAASGALLGSMTPQANSQANPT